MRTPYDDYGDDSDGGGFEDAPVPRKKRRLNRRVLDTSEVEEDDQPHNAPTVKTKATRQPRKGSNAKSISDPEPPHDQLQDSKPRKPRGRPRKNSTAISFGSPELSDTTKTTASRGRPRKPSPDPNLVKVRKHRIRVNESKPVLQDAFCTQAPPPSSCPWMVRGPIWQKQKVPVQEALPGGDGVVDVAKVDGLVSSQLEGLGPTGATQVVENMTGVGMKMHGPRKEDVEVDSSESDDDAFEPLGVGRKLIVSSAAGSETGSEVQDQDSEVESTSLESVQDTSEHGQLEAQNSPERGDPGNLQIQALPNNIISSDWPLDDQLVPSSLILQEEIPRRTQHTMNEVDQLMRSSHQSMLENSTKQLPSVIPAEIEPPDKPPGFDVSKELEDLPSDAFASSTPSPTRSPQRPPPNPLQDSIVNQHSKQPRLAAPQKGLRQMTLFGDPAQHMSLASQANKVHNWPVSSRNEAPTHHKLNEDALTTWLYPTNLGTIRDYQYNIVLRGLYHNLLVALPTGLGKTFIAATIMLNWYRWTKDAQIVFVAPTKPLVSQQVGACFGVAGIPRSETSMLTGGIPPGLRAEEWQHKRVFFMTPQTIVNDLKTGICDPKRIVLLVVDEAHRATGNYAYVEVVQEIRRFNPSFRVLGLTATPGSSVESVQQVIDGLDISRIEIRTEFSIDIRQYIHSRDTETFTFDPSDEMEFVSKMFCDAVQPVLSQLVQHNGYWSRDPMSITVYALHQQQKKWSSSTVGQKAHVGVKVKVHKIFAILIRLAPSVELLKFHGIRAFHKGMKKFQQECENNTATSKFENEITDHKQFKNLMANVERFHTKPNFAGHPKLEHLEGVILRHFTHATERRDPAPDAAHRPTRIMVFVHYRTSAEVITEYLSRHAPLVKPHLFVGQAASKDKEGMDQNKQLDVINKFKDGTYNVLVATSIGEEGLDIGEIDLIVCYDASASPIRMLQRMGRTGRKRAGNIVILLMKGKEEESFAKAKRGYEEIQKMICEEGRFEFHHDRSTRIVPREIEPVVEKKFVEIPQENSQAELPEPKKGKGRIPKRPPKKFHMPDGVRTGFVSASRLDGDDDGNGNENVDEAPAKKRKRPGRPSRNSGPELAPIPSLDHVLLTAPQVRELQKRYTNVSDITETEIRTPRVGNYPEHQRSLTGTRYIKHCARTKTVVKTLEAIHEIDLSTVARLEEVARTIDVDSLCSGYKAISSEPEQPQSPSPPPRPPTKSTSTKNAPRTKPPPKSKAPPKTSKKIPLRTFSPDPMEAPPSSAPLTSPRMALASQGISLGSADTDGEDAAEGVDSSLADFVVDGSEEEEAEARGGTGSDGEDDSDEDDDLDDLVLPAVAQKSRANAKEKGKDLALFTSDLADETCSTSALQGGTSARHDSAPAGVSTKRQKTRRVIAESSDEDE